MIDSTRHDSTDAPTTALAVASSLVRASHAERAATVDRLHAALGEGRLELDETEERVAAAYGSSYRSDLLPLLADLPASRTSRSSGRLGPGVADDRQAGVGVSGTCARDTTN